MTKVITRTYSLTKEYQSLLIGTLFIGCIVSAVLYAFNIYSIVTKTVAVGKIEAQTASVEKTVQVLDTQYILLSNKITPEMAKSYGLHEGVVSAYIPRTTSLGRAQESSSNL
jgi:hypothetical protein